MTNKKQTKIKKDLDEYSKIVGHFIVKYENEIPLKSKFDLCLASHIRECQEETNTWLSARLIKNAFCEGYGMVQSAKSKSKYVRPKHCGKKAILSSTINTQSEETSTKIFDFNVTLGSIGNKQKISIPLKKHKQFNSR